MNYVCTICEERLESESMAAIKCGHTFHLRCLNRWRAKSCTCPLCRFVINNFESEVFSHLFLETAKFTDVSEVNEDGCNSEVHERLESENSRLRRKNKKLQDSVDILRHNYRVINEDLYKKSAKCKKNKSQLKKCQNELDETRKQLDSALKEKEEVFDKLVKRVRIEITPLKTKRSQNSLPNGDVEPNSHLLSPIVLPAKTKNKTIDRRKKAIFKMLKMDSSSEEEEDTSLFNSTPSSTMQCADDFHSPSSKKNRRETTFFPSRSVAGEKFNKKSKVRNICFQQNCNNK